MLQEERTDLTNGEYTFEECKKITKHGADITSENEI